MMKTPGYYYHCLYQKKNKQRKKPKKKPNNYKQTHTQRSNKYTKTPTITKMNAFNDPP